MNESNIYRDVLLKHALHPKNSGILECPDLRASAYNPLCGDELELTLTLSEDTIDECKAKVRGCSICQASASMMSELILSKTLKEAVHLSLILEESLKKENEEVPKKLEYLRPLISMKKHKSRIKCINLAWDALKDCAGQKEI